MHEDRTTPYGLCECGCGGPTTIAKSGDRKYGWVKGEPKRFITGHHTRSGPEYLAEDRGYETPCWIWQRYVSPYGYGSKWFNGRVQNAHRAYYQLRHGIIEDRTMDVHHKCRVRLCVNPDHLEALNERVHMAGHTALASDVADEIRAKAIPYVVTYEMLAAEYGVSRNTIWRIVAGIRR